MASPGPSFNSFRSLPLLALVGLALAGCPRKSQLQVIGEDGRIEKRPIEHQVFVGQDLEAAKIVDLVERDQMVLVYDVADAVKICPSVPMCKDCPKPKAVGSSTGASDVITLSKCNWQEVGFFVRPPKLRVMITLPSRCRACLEPGGCKGQPACLSDVIGRVEP